MTVRRSRTEVIRSPFGRSQATEIARLWQGWSRSQGDDLARIHDVLGSIARFKRPHQSSASDPMLGLEILHLLLTNAVLARAGALHGERPLHQPLEESLDLATSPASSMSTIGWTWKLPSPTWPTMGAIRPIASMSLLRLGDALGEPRDRHAHVGGDGLGSRPQEAGSPIGVMARLPQAGAVLRSWSPIRRDRRRIRPAISPNRSACSFDARLGAVELDEAAAASRASASLEWRLHGL